MRKKIYSLCVILLFFFVSIGGCSAKSAQLTRSSIESNDYEETYEPAIAAYMKKSEMDDRQVESISSDTSDTSDIGSGQKIIKNVSLRIETKDFFTSAAGLEQILKENDGYVESSSVSGGGHSSQKYGGEYTFRVPSENLDNFLEKVKSSYSVISENISTDDVSSRYYDTQARLETLRIQQQRLNELIAEAKKLEDIITLNQALTDVEYEIEALAGNLKGWDFQVDYSRVNISMTELTERETGKTPVTFGEEIGSAWQNSLSAIKSIGKGIIIVFVFLVPFLLIAACVLLFTLLVVKRVRKRTKKKK